MDIFKEVNINGENLRIFNRQSRKHLYCSTCKTDWKMETQSRTIERYNEIYFTKISRLRSQTVVASLLFKGLATVTVWLPVFSFHLIRLSRGEAKFVRPVNVNGRG